MIIGIDASRAFQKNRTGIEEYSYQVIKHLMNKLEKHRVILYLKNKQKIDFILPENWEIKVIKFPYLWTHIGLSLELFLHPVDILFIPGHVAPIVHPKNTIVTIHGLEYEFCPKAYSFWARIYMRWAIKRSCRVAKKVIAVSENTKKDLVNLYKVPGGKIGVIYEGAPNNFQFSIFNFQSIFNDKIKKPYLLFIGRLEERKNIIGIIKSFEILKEKYKIPHKLVLAGGEGYKYKSIKYKVEYLKNKNDIILTGFVSEEEKWELLKNADVFLFPTFYEGFGLPILEAQSAGVPLVASNNSSILEIVKIPLNPPFAKGENGSLPFQKGEVERDFYSAILVNPNNLSEIAEATYRLISDKALRDDIIKKGYENAERFSWEKCTIQVAKLLNG